MRIRIAHVKSVPGLDDADAIGGKRYGEMEDLPPLGACMSDAGYQQERARRVAGEALARNDNVTASHALRTAGGLEPVVCAGAGTDQFILCDCTQGARGKPACGWHV